MEPSIKTLSYKNKVVFQKLRSPYFNTKLPKEYYENEACFVFVNQGAFLVREPVQVIELNTENFLLGKCINYFYETTEKQRENNTYIEVIGVLIYPELVEEIFEFDIRQSTHTFDFNLVQVPVNKLLDNFRESIDILIDNPKLADENLIANKLKEFILLISKTINAPSELDFLSGIFKPTTSPFDTIIQANLYTKISVKELAFLCNMSVASFKRNFQTYYTTSPIKYLKTKKIERAKVLLKQEKKTIASIAYEIGFESISAFNRSFKTEVGCSPSSYQMS